MSCDDMEICKIYPEFEETLNCVMKKMLGKCPKVTEEKQEAKEE